MLTFRVRFNTKQGQLQRTVRYSCCCSPLFVRRHRLEPLALKPVLKLPHPLLRLLRRLRSNRNVAARRMSERPRIPTDKLSVAIPPMLIARADEVIE